MKYVYKLVSYDCRLPKDKRKYFSYLAGSDSPNKLKYSLGKTTICPKDFLPIFAFKDTKGMVTGDVYFKCEFEPAKQPHLGCINPVLIHNRWDEMLKGKLKIVDDCIIKQSKNTIFCNSVTPIELIKVE